jgi:hypothetical protein
VVGELVKDCLNFFFPYLLSVRCVAVAWLVCWGYAGGLLCEVLEVGGKRLLLEFGFFGLRFAVFPPVG